MHVHGIWKISVHAYCSHRVAFLVNIYIYIYIFILSSISFIIEKLQGCHPIIQDGSRPLWNVALFQLNFVYHSLSQLKPHENKVIFFLSSFLSLPYESNYKIMRFRLLINLFYAWITCALSIISAFVVVNLTCIEIFIFMPPILE